VAAHGGWLTARTRAIALLAAGTAALSALVTTGTATARPLSAQPSAQGSPIKHIVVLYLENHTFDDLLGYWCRHKPGRCPDGGMPSSVTLSDGTVVTPHVLPDIVPDVSHSVAAQRAAIDGGKMDGWQNVRGCGPETGYACIAGYKPAQVPNLTALARRFAMSDRTFSMANSPSWGGHLYAVMPSLDGFKGDNPFPAPGVTKGPGWGCDSNRITPWKAADGTVQLVPSCIPDYKLGLANGGAFEATPVKHAPTILDRLQAAGRPWRIYGEPPPEPGGAFPTARGYGWDICPSFAGCLYTRQKANNVPSSTFVKTARSGHLPSFAIIIPGGEDAPFSEHNGFSITTGDDWLGQIASAVMNGPQWRSTVLFITWDDCGCFYDQVPPGRNPDGTPQGPRTPLIIVSPYARHSYTDTTATTFAGILAYTEHNFGLTPLGVNDARAYAFGHAFDYQQAALSPARMVYRPWPRDAYHVDMTQADDDT
jgi:phospholipase C